MFGSRLLRNRVSAQQARERKKAYLSELEIRSKELEHRNAELEERVSTLQRENQMLRQARISDYTLLFIQPLVESTSDLRNLRMCSCHHMINLNGFRVDLMGIVLHAAV